jgi:hypothetical protein
MRSYETQYERVQKETEKKEVLTSRREKLQRLLETERDMHTEELTARVSPVLQPVFNAVHLSRVLDCDCGSMHDASGTIRMLW